MSRLIVKNLPNYISDSRLRDHFASQGGNITDVKLVHRSDGLSRRFAFVGFKTDAEALKAKEYFDRTYIDSSRISVLVADQNRSTERPAKRQRLDPSSSTSTPPKSTKPSRQTKDDPVLSEFLQVTAPRNKKERTWANEDAGLAAPIPTPSDPILADFSSSEPITDKVIEKKTGKKRDEKSSHMDSADDEAGPSVEGEEEAISDLEWMRRRMAKSALLPAEDVEMGDGDYSSKPSPDFVQSESEDENEGEQADQKPNEATVHVDDSKTAALPTDDAQDDSPRLFLRNLAYSCTSEDLQTAFEKFGSIAQVHIPQDNQTHTPKGIAFITFTTPTSARSALDAMHKSTFQGRILHVTPAMDRTTKSSEDGKRVSVKDKKAKERKDGAGREFNWGMLYMNSDAVVSSVADRLKISKADILNPDESNAAVKLALAETHVIQETKKYLEDHGVILDSFKTLARSPTTLLIKNIPYGTTLETLTDLFSPHGEIIRLLLPPAGTMAVVEFNHPDEAAKALKSVAYRRLGNSLIYLERAPLGIFKEGEERTKDIASGVKPVVVPAKDIVSIADDGEEGAAPSNEAAAAQGSTLFIKNLSFNTTTASLLRTFQNLPSFAFARVQTKPDPKKPGSTLSMGYGFVGFKDKKAAEKAMGSMQGFVLDGHSLVVKWAQRGQDDDVNKEAEKSMAGGRTTKMIVKNLPFEVTKKDVQALFSAHGQLKSVRLPKKFNAGSRGFAFLDFVSRAEAENAYNALKHSHFLGRHLVLEWAQENGPGADVETLRQKVKSGYGDGGKSELPGRKRKIDMDVLGDGGDDEEDGFIAV